MIKQVFAFLMVITMFVLASGTQAIAQNNSSKQEQKTAKVKEKIKKLGLGERTRIKVKLYTGTTHQGYVSAANDDDFVVVDQEGKSSSLKYSDVDTVGGKNLSTGAKVAIGVGIGVGATLLALYLIFVHITRNN